MRLMPVEEGCVEGKEGKREMGIHFDDNDVEKRARWKKEKRGV